ncbi:MAG: PhnD/SsuA/transferrin family substrate-binding protein [Trichlorobacter sp.]|uniref:PhnD/SsuA/transferrin family substrate-binding protein n=1 Tax=Trichlorobacter sp. TaxID=2911007 RepID=UPI00256AC9E0|nr:PhnD/SsuA/transferrin family substrate-binding protein [Trichlorobacter sp.]MDK9718305.1 PhnD/SsuA/transferrin family substrate-binding protein [Trichlorobacter sp.]
MTTSAMPDTVARVPWFPSVFFGLMVFFTALLLVGCNRQPAEKPLQYSKTPAAASLPVYRFAVHPLHNPAKLAEAYQPLIDQINSQIPEARFELEASRDYQAYEEKFRSGSPEFLLPNPWQTLEAMKSGYQVIAMAGDAEDFKGIFIARKDSNIKKPADLKGKTVSYPSHTALAACIMPQFFLHRHGINVNRDITNIYVGSQESSIMSAYLGQSAVGVTWPVPWRLFQQDHPKEAAQLHLLWETPHLLNNSVMARTTVPPAISQQVRRVLLELSQSAEGRTILSAMATAQFHAADNASYQKVLDYVAAFEKQVRPVEKK